MLELADALEHDRDVTGIRNLHVATAMSSIATTSDRQCRSTSCPCLDRELYYKYPFLRDMPMKRFIASMGCPHPARSVTSRSSVRCTARTRNRTTCAASPYRERSRRSGTSRTGIR